MRKIIRLNESELIYLIKKVISEKNEPEEFEEIPFDDESFFDDEDFIDDNDDTESYLDLEKEFDDDEEFQNRMKYKQRMRKNIPGSIGIGGGKRWDKDSDREVEQGKWSPIKPSDISLDKYLASKK